MTNPANVFQPAIDALEKDLADLERQADGLITSINLLRSKAGLPLRSGGREFGRAPDAAPSHAATLTIHSDTFTGKKLGAAVREYLTMRKQSGGDAPATSREIFDALKRGGFSSGAKDEPTALVVLRTMLRKDTKGFVKLSNGKYGLRAWYPDLRQPKAPKSTANNGVSDAEIEEDQESEATVPEDENEGTAAA